ncbi:MAG: hypothetical protein SV775_11450 [Thermodesulfobacteriota bacterium]|nr:hypothetical protein [Thermodesulfobacteriota bacterium]
MGLTRIWSKKTVFVRARSSYKENETVTPEYMQSQEEIVGFGPNRAIELNRVALGGLPFIAMARHNGQIIGMVRPM